MLTRPPSPSPSPRPQAPEPINKRASPADAGTTLAGTVSSCCELCDAFFFYNYNGVDDYDRFWFVDVGGEFG